MKRNPAANKLKQCYERFEKYFNGKYYLSIKQQTFLFRQLSYLLASGYSLERALYQLLGKDEKQKSGRQRNWQKAVTRMLETLQDTGSLSLAIESLALFEPSVIYRIESGEVSGGLETVLEEVSRTFEVNGNIRRSIIAMMLYPFVIVLGLIGMSYFMASEIMPEIITVITELKVEISGLTKVVISISSFIKDYGGYAALGIAAFVMCCAAALKVRKIRLTFDRVLLKIPYIKDVARIMDLVRYSNVFYSLYEAGVDLETTLDCSAKTVKNLYLKDRALKSKGLVIEAGLELSEALLASGLFDYTEIDLIDISIATDKVGEVFRMISEHATRELEAVVKSMMSMLEPFTIIILGIMVGCFVIGIYSPMSSVLSNI